jgi:predicted membrane GTPase involved in stress response
LVMQFLAESFGWACFDGTQEPTLEPLFDVVMEHVPAPDVVMDGPLQMLITNLDYDEHKGRIALGRINSG